MDSPISSEPKWVLTLVNGIESLLQKKFQKKIPNTKTTKLFQYPRLDHITPSIPGAACICSSLALSRPSHQRCHHQKAPAPIATIAKLPRANHLKSLWVCHTAAAIQCPRLTRLTIDISVPPKEERFAAGTSVCVSWVAQRSYVHRKRSDKEIERMRMMVLRGYDAMGCSSGLAVLLGGVRRCASRIKRLKTAGVWEYFESH